MSSVCTPDSSKISIKLNGLGPWGWMVWVKNWFSLTGIVSVSNLIVSVVSCEAFWGTSGVSNFWSPSCLLVSSFLIEFSAVCFLSWFSLLVDSGDLGVSIFLSSSFLFSTLVSVVTPSVWASFTVFSSLLAYIVQIEH